VRARSTLGTFLRSFTHGQVKQLQSVGKRVLVELASATDLLRGGDVLALVDVDSTTPRPGRKEGRQVPAGACTGLRTHYLLGDRDLATFTASVVKDLTGSVIVHDRYQNYDSAQPGQLTH
jgi:hypothetical protein